MWLEESQAGQVHVLWKAGTLMPMPMEFSCEGCGKPGLHFERVKMPDGRMQPLPVDSNNIVHSCPEYKALKAQGQLASQQKLTGTFNPASVQSSPQSKGWAAEGTTGVGKSSYGVSMPSDVQQVVSPKTLTELSEKLAMVEKNSANALSSVNATTQAFVNLKLEHESLQKDFNSLLKDYMALDQKWEDKLSSKQVLEVVHPDGTVIEIGKQHRQFRVVLKKVLAARLSKQAVWLYGEPGSMKTSMAKPIAESLGLGDRVWVVPCSWTMTLSDLLGFQAPSGSVVGKPARWAFENGGLIMYDEAALCNPNTFASMNALISNDFVTFPDGTTIQKHPDCHIICADNTNGGGDERYGARSKMDFASRTRFFFIEVNTDWDFVADILEANGVDKTWAYKVKALNAICAKRKIEWTVSSRVALAAIGQFPLGFTESDILDDMLWPNVSVSERAQIESDMGQGV